MYQEQRKAWTDAGGELISLPREEQASMMASLSSVGDDVSKSKPALHEAYQIVATRPSGRDRRRANDLKQTAIGQIRP